MNEYQEWLSDLTDEQRKNHGLCMKYPILVPMNANNDYMYEYTVLDMMPSGWRIAFGEYWARDVQEELNKLPKEDRDEIVVLDIKEKYGFLDVDINYYGEELGAVLDKYKELSKRTCIGCGKPATKISWSWVCPWCGDCSKQINGKMIDVKKWFKED